MRVRSFFRIVVGLSLLVGLAWPAAAQRGVAELEQIRRLVNELEERMHREHETVRRNVERRVEAEGRTGREAGEGPAIERMEREKLRKQGAISGDQRRARSLDGKKPTEGRRPPMAGPPRSYLLEFRSGDHSAAVSVVEGGFSAQMSFRERSETGNGDDGAEREEEHGHERSFQVEGRVTPHGDLLRIEFTASREFEEAQEQEGDGHEEEHLHARSSYFVGSCVVRAGEEAVIARDGEDVLRLVANPMGPGPRERDERRRDSERREEHGEERVRKPAEGDLSEQVRDMLIKALIGESLEEF